MRRIAAVVLLLLVSTVAFAGADEYTIDRAHSSANFSVRHMMLSTVHGRFTDWSASVVYDPADVTKATVKATIKAASITTDNENRDKDLRSPNFFDVEQFPEITFVGEKIEKRGDQLVLVGTFTMHGVTKKIELPFQILGTLTDARGNTRIGVEATTKLNRKEYAINWNRMLDNGGAVVSDEVQIQLNLELVHRVGPPPGAPAQTPPAQTPPPPQQPPK